MKRNRNLSPSRVNNARGIYRATVTAVSTSNDTVSVKIPRLSNNIVYDQVPFYGDKPAVDDEIVVGFLEGQSNTPVALILTGKASTLTSGGGGSSVGGANTQVQYNNSGVLAGSANMTFDGTSLNVAGLKLANTAVTSTAAELNLLDGITAGTVSASLAVIVDSDKDITGFRNVTLTGELDAATLDISGDADIDGTTNLDAVDIDGNVQLDGTFTIGTNDTGYDLKLWGATADKFLLWDESDNMLEITGVNGTNALAVHDGNVYIADKLTFPSSAPSDANINIEFAEGYKIYTDNTGAGSDNSRFWLEAPDNGEIVLGPRGGSDILDNMRLRSTTIAAEGNVNVTGNVGIGTTSPVGQLSVDSQNRQISIIDSGTVNYAEIRAHAVDSATSYANVNYNAYSHNFLIEGTSKIIIDNNGDIRPTTDSTSDLGTSSHYFELAYVDQYKGGNGSSSAPTYGFGSDANTGIYRKASDQLAIAAGGVEAYFATNGLHLASGDWFRTYGDSGIYFATHGGGWRMTGSTYIETYGSKSIDVKGNIKLNAMATFTGSGYATARRQDSTGILKEFTSSERWKTDLADIPLADAEKVLNCRPIYFRSKEEKEADPNSQVYVGISAESLQSAGYEWPLKYDIDEDGNQTNTPRGIHYELLVTPLITIIKDLKARIEALES